MTEWSAPHVHEWKAWARRQQQYFCTKLGDRRWDFFDIEQGDALLEKIGFGLFGPPTLIPNENGNHSSGYSPAQVTQMQKISDTVGAQVKYRINKEDKWFACIVVLMKVQQGHTVTLVFKSLKSEETGEAYFIDALGRVYDGWNAFLEDNKFPPCIYCYPTDGTYTESNGHVNIDFALTPACNTTTKALKIMDNTFAVGTIVGVAVPLAVGMLGYCIPVWGVIQAIATVAASVGVFSGAYIGLRSAGDLIDRYQHCQPIGWGSTEAMNDWITIVALPMVGVEALVIREISQASEGAQILSRAGRIIYKLTGYGMVAVGSVGIVHQLSYLAQKLKQGTLTALDVSQFVVTLMFFYNITITSLTAHAIIQNAELEYRFNESLGIELQPLPSRQLNLGESYGIEFEPSTSHTYCTNLIASQEDKSKKPTTKKNRKTEKTNPQNLTEGQKAQFETLTKKLKKECALHDDPDVVKAIKSIDSVAVFMESMVTKRKGEQLNNHDADLTTRGLININGELVIDPAKFNRISAKSREAIVSMSQFRTLNLIKEVEYQRIVEGISSCDRIIFESERRTVPARLCEALEVDIVGKIDVGGVKIFDNMEPFQVDRVGVVMMSAGRNYDAEFTRYAIDFAASRHCKTVSEFCYCVEFMDHYLKNSKVANEAMSKEALKSWNDEKHPRNKHAAASQFEKLKSVVGPRNRDSRLQFSREYTAIYHFAKPKGFGSKEETPKEYFEMASNLFGTKTNRATAVLSQNGDAKNLIYICPQKGIKSIKIERIAGGDIIATVMYQARLLRRE